MPIRSDLIRGDHRALYLGWLLADVLSLSFIFYLSSKGEQMIRYYGYYSPAVAVWDVKRKPPPRANAPPPETLIFYDDSPSPPRAEQYLIDPDYPADLSRRSWKNEDGKLPVKESAVAKPVNRA